MCICMYVCDNTYKELRNYNWRDQKFDVNLIENNGKLKNAFFLNCFPKVYEVHQTHTYKTYCTYNSLCEAADFLGLSKSCNR